MYIVVETIMNVEEKEMCTYTLGAVMSPMDATEIMYRDIRNTLEEDFGYTMEMAESYVGNLFSYVEHYMEYEDLRYYKWTILTV